MNDRFVSSSSDHFERIADTLDKCVEGLSEARGANKSYQDVDYPKNINRLEDFKIGDLVYLRSGSPGMTVINIEEVSVSWRFLRAPSIGVVWVFEGTTHRDNFPPEVLEFM